MTTKQHLLSTLLTFVSFSCLAQIQFEKGYFIDNNGERVDCQIRNQDWDISPDRIKYKLSEEGDVRDLDLSEMAGFSVGNYIKYTRFITNVDMSSDNPSTLSQKRGPDLVVDTFLLKSEVEGLANLYSLHKYSRVRYYYSVDGSELEPLIYKKYAKTYNTRTENKTYIQQLKNKLSCHQISARDFNQTRYSKSSLLKLFKKYHDCKGVPRNTFDNNLPKKALHLTARAGVHLSNADVKNVQGRNFLTLEPSLGFQLGLQVEYFLNFNKDKWSVYGEPTLHVLKIAESKEKIEINYTSLEFNLGVRHYFYLSDKSQVFLSGGFNHFFGSDLNSEIIHPTQGTYDLGTVGHMVGGIGFLYNKKVSLEASYGFKRRIFRKSRAFNSDYRSIYFLFGYRLF